VTLMVSQGTILIDGLPACSRCAKRPRRPKQSYCGPCHTDYCAERRRGMVEVLLTPAEWHQVKQARLEAAYQERNV
jgi:hypothetical protein